MNDSFAEKVYPVISSVLDLLDETQSDVANQPIPGEVFPRLKQVLGSVEGDGSERKPLELAKRALVYWVDEVLVNSNWAHANEWQNSTLERELYDARDRAWKFFEAARSARAFGRPDTLETFYLCVALGFRGVYRGKGFLPEGGQAPAPEKKKESTEGEKAASMTWFGDSGVFNPDETWGFGNLPKAATEESLFDSSLMSPQAEENAYGLPRTLEEWAGPVFAQVAPPVTENFVPTFTAERQRDARPLRGKRTLRRTLRILVVSAVVTFALFLLWLLVN